MILQRVAQNLKRHDWSAILIEVLVVVIGIFIGLQVDGWNDARQDRLREGRYLTRIYDELAADIVSIEGGIQVAETRHEMGKLLAAALNSPELVRADPPAFFRAIEQAGYTFSPAINDYSFEELKLDGNLGIIRDVELRRALTSYYKLIKNYGQWAYRREHFQNTYADRKLGILTPEQSSKLEPYDSTAEFTEREALAALERMAGKQKFIEQINRASNNGQVIGVYNGWRDAAEQLRERIKLVIGNNGDP